MKKTHGLFAICFVLQIWCTQNAYAGTNQRQTDCDRRANYFKAYIVREQSIVNRLWGYKVNNTLGFNWVFGESDAIDYLDDVSEKDLRFGSAIPISASNNLCSMDIIVEAYDSYNIIHSAKLTVQFSIYGGYDIDSRMDQSQILRFRRVFLTAAHNRRIEAFRSIGYQKPEFGVRKTGQEIETQTEKELFEQYAYDLVAGMNEPTSYNEGEQWEGLSRAMQQLIISGIIPRKASKRISHASYFPVLKEFKFAHGTLQGIRVEGYLPGEPCCVSPSVAILLKIRDLQSNISKAGLEDCMGEITNNSDSVIYGKQPFKSCPIYHESQYGSWFKCEYKVQTIIERQTRFDEKLQKTENVEQSPSVIGVDTQRFENKIFANSHTFGVDEDFEKMIREFGIEVKPDSSRYAIYKCSKKLGDSAL